MCVKCDDRGYTDLRGAIATLCDCKCALQKALGLPWSPEEEEDTDAEDSSPAETPDLFPLAEATV